MKQLLKITSVLLLLLFGCDKDPLEGTGMASKAGQSWNGKALINTGGSCCQDNLSFVIETYSIEGFRRESLNFGNVPKEVKRFLFSPHSATNPGDAIAVASYSTLASDGDVLTSIYWPIENDPDNFIEITEIDKKHIKGFFRVTMILNPLYQANPSLPDTIRFENGTFELN